MCPRCSEEMFIKNKYTLVCLNNHYCYIPIPNFIEVIYGEKKIAKKFDSASFAS
jgi:hypothetical protein